MSLKLAGLKLDLQYFDKCYELNLIPDYLKFKPPKLEVLKNSDSFYKQALFEQKKDVLKRLRECKSEYQNSVNNLRSSIGLMQFRVLVSVITSRTVKSRVIEKKKRHNVKLYQLWKRQRPSVPNCVINMSRKQLNVSEENALLFGLNHHILPKRINPNVIKANVEHQVSRICRNSKVSLSFDSKNNIREATDRFIHEAASACNTRRNKYLHRTLYNISKNTNIKICKMDKGIGVVIVDTEDYYKKLNVIVEDKSRFVKLDYNPDTDKLKDCFLAPWVLKENSVYSYCNRHIQPLVDKTTYYRLIPRGSQPGRLYGMAKHHKRGCPMRPVLSAINTAEYNLAKWMEQQLKPFLTNSFSVSSSTEFVDHLSSLKPQPSEICVSFDIKSLFTHVPLMEVVEDITSTVYSDTATSSIFANSKTITKKIFRNILKVCSESIFLYNGAVYKQKDGVAMGSPLAPLLAEWFVSTIENKILLQDEHQPYKPLVYKRYVDDVFAVFRCVADRDAFFKVLNEAHPNLQFTMENSKPLPFLDVSVSIENEAYTTEVYRKPTNTGVTMNFSCAAPTQWKKALARCLLRRAHRLSSCFSKFTSEVENIKTILGNNGYPDHFVKRAVSVFIEQHHINKDNFMASKQTYLTKKTKDPTDGYMTVPYTGKPSLRFQRRLRKEMEQYSVTIVPSYTTTKIGSYFSLKSSPSMPFKSNVVYEFHCSCDKNTT